MTPQIRRRLAYAGTAAVFASVGGPAFVASYGHAWTVVERYGAPGDSRIAGWLPLTTDGLLVAVLIVIAVRRAAGQPIGRLPITAFAAGMIATIAANLAAAPIDPARPGYSIGALAVALWPPVAVMLTLELLAITLRAIVTAWPDVPAGGDDTGTVASGSPVFAAAGPLDMDGADEAEASRPRAVATRRAPSGESARQRVTPPPPPDPAPARRLTDDELMREVRAWAERDNAVPSRDSIATAYGIGSTRSTRIKEAVEGERVPA